MPELPEVEVVRRGVQQWAAGRTVLDVVIHDERSLRRYVPGPAAFREGLTGCRLGQPQRRGKFLWVPLENLKEDDARWRRGQTTTGSSQFVDAMKGGQRSEAALALVIHLGMSGQVLMQAASAPAQKHLKVTLGLGPPAGEQPAAGTAGLQKCPDQLRFIDQRIFGGMQLSPLVPDSSHPSGAVPQVVTHIAPDPLEPAVTAEWLFRALRRRRTGLKRALLDQTMISGVGNIYADEALWAAQLHYARRTETVTRAQAAVLLVSLRRVMEAALAAGGTSFDALYVNVNGASGYFDRSLEAYGQAGQPCARCAGSDLPARQAGGLIRREKFMGRSSYFCPVCQPRPRHGRW